MTVPNLWYGELDLPDDAHRERLERRITELAAHVHAATAKLLPRVRERFELGELSCSQVRALSRLQRAPPFGCPPCRALGRRRRHRQMG